MAVVFSDLNTRFDTSNLKFLSKDAQAVIQSIWRLITTEEAEIPYYRDYGCNLKQFEQYPMTEITADEIFEYIKERINKYEPRGELVSSDAIADLTNNTLHMKLYIKVKATGETGVLPDLDVNVQGNV